MFPINKSFAFGISPHLLFPQAELNPLRHLEAVSRASALPGYETLEMFLPEDFRIRQEEISIVRDSGKRINYNFPVDFQFDGAFNAGSADPKIRQNALDLARRNIDYAAEASSALLAITSCIDQGEAQRPAVLERFGEFFLKIAGYAKERKMVIALEAAERGIFKNLLLGPTSETAAFIKSMRAQGCDNAYTMVDTAHLPLMGEAFSPALALSVDAGIAHMHIGSSVLRPESAYYGHKHPPLGVQDGVYDVQDAADFFLALLDCGYLSLEERAQKPLVSLEMLPYPGVSSETSAQAAYEKICFAFENAAYRFTEGQ